jgi:hypothetical protein
MNNQPRGLRNNNPGNIRIGESAFLGEIKPSRDNAFRQFETMAHGYRALFMQLSLYLSRGIDTIEKIINTWAPEAENHTAAYISVVCRNTGIDRKKVLTENSGDDYIKIVSEISHVENGVKANLSDVIAGFELQDKIKK